MQKREDFERRLEEILLSTYGKVYVSQLVLWSFLKGGEGMGLGEFLVEVRGMGKLLRMAWPGLPWDNQQRHSKQA